MTPRWSVARPVPAVATVAALALGLAGCTGGPEAPTPAGRISTPGYEAAACPDDVVTAIPAEVECGYLTVPETRPAGDTTLRLLVAEVAAPSGSPEADPVVAVSTAAPFYAGIAPLAQRTGRRLLFLEPRGTGRADPSLVCPEPADGVAWTDPTGSRRWRHKVRQGIAGCRRALTDEGVDLAAYDVASMAQDYVDLLDARGIERAILISYDVSALVSFELMRHNSDRLSAVVMDSPDVPGVDPRPLVPGLTRRAIDRVLRWCADDEECVPREPDPATLLDRALAALAERPWRLRVPTATPPATVLLDPALLLRVTRNAFTDGGSSGPVALPEEVPRLLSAVVRGDRAYVARALGVLLGTRGPLCVGYRPKCGAVRVQDTGVDHSMLCRDVAPAGPGRSPRVPGIGFREAYTHAPWWQVCARWPVLPAAASSAAPVSSDVPTLILVGGLAASTPAAQVRARTRGLTSASLVVVPTGSQNVMGPECVFEIRNAWLADPRPIAEPPDCLERRLEW